MWKIKQLDPHEEIRINELRLNLTDQQQFFTTIVMSCPNDSNKKTH